jgi:hypothetical protein
MRKALVAVVALAAVTPTTLHAQAWAEKMFRDKDAKDNPLVHDFGSVPRGAKLLHRFKITNIYAVEMQIADIRASCTCGSAKETKKVLKPREVGYIEVTMDTTRFAGPKTISIFVTVGPEYTSTAELKVSANSRADVVFNPAQVTLGVVPRGQASAKQEVDVEYAGTLDWKITEIKTNNAPIEATFKEWYRKPGQVGYKITVGLKVDAPVGPVKEEIFVKTTDPNCPLLPVLVEATVQPPLSATPEIAKMETVIVGQAKTMRVFVRGSKAFRITGIDGQEDGITAETPNAAGETHVVTIKCQPARAGEFKRPIVIKTDLDKDASVTVTVEGTAVSPQ